MSVFTKLDEIVADVKALGTPAPATVDFTAVLNAIAAVDAKVEAVKASIGTETPVA